MIAQWLGDILSRVVAGGMGRKMWQTVIFLANSAGKMARWLAKWQFDCSKQPPHLERFSPGTPPKSSVHLPKAAAPIT